MAKPIFHGGDLGRHVVAVYLRDGTWMDIDPGTFKLDIIDIASDDGRTWSQDTAIVRFKITPIGPPGSIAKEYVFLREMIGGVQVVD